MRPLALDLFCGAGGASEGLRQAGFDVLGVDIRPQPRYPFHFIQADALSFLETWIVPHEHFRLLGEARKIEFIWASPPCQKNTALRTMPNARSHECLIEPTRALLKQIGPPWAMENVVGAPLINPVTLCGTSFGLSDPGGCLGHGPWELQRHRLVEARFPLPQLPCNHRVPCLGVYGGHVRDRRRREGSESRGRSDPPRELAENLMGIHWMTLDELSQSIPPAYSRWVAEQWIAPSQK